jgi:FkbM family methyltransferase
MKSTVKDFLRKSFASLGYDIVRRSDRVQIYTRPGLNILYMLAALLHQSKKEPIQLIQVGANDGVREDNVVGIIDKFPCRALLVEPQPHAFGALQERYKNYDNVILEQKPISSKRGVLEFFMSSKPEQSEITSTSKEHVEKHLATYNAREASGTPAKVTSVVLDCTTIPDLAKKHRFEKIDIMTSDTEGMDYEIVGSVLDSGLDVGVLHFEIANMTSAQLRDISVRLKDAGYLLAQAGFDFMAVKSSLAKGNLANLLRLPDASA